MRDNYISDGGSLAFPGIPYPEIRAGRVPAELKRSFPLATELIRSRDHKVGQTDACPLPCPPFGSQRGKPDRSDSHLATRTLAFPQGAIL